MKKDIFHYALSAFVVGGMALSFASCSDNDLAANQGGSNDALVRFSVNDVQSEAIARGAITPGLGNTMTLPDRNLLRTAIVTSTYASLRQPLRV